MNSRVRVLYAGRVQGVGFRFSVEGFAKRYGVKGWVKNLPAGGVELEAQAERPSLDAFLEAINSRFQGYIKHADMEWLPVAGEYNDFIIRF